MLVFLTFFLCAMFFTLLTPNFMGSFEKILRAFLRQQRDAFIGTLSFQLGTKKLTTPINIAKYFLCQSKSTSSSFNMKYAGSCKIVSVVSIGISTVLLDASVPLSSVTLW